MEQDSALQTFAIPFYEGTAYLKEAVQSVLAQSTPRWKLIVVDDCGPDSDEVRHYLDSLTDPRISFHKNPKNLGLAGNWNRCIDIASTELVTLLHSDDRLLPTYCETMTGLAAQNPDAALLFCRARIIDSEGRPTFSFPDRYKDFLVPSLKQNFLVNGDQGLAGLSKGNFINCPTVLYRKSKLVAERFDPTWQMVLDLEFYARLLLKGRSLYGVVSTLYEYRRHDQNQTTKLTENLRRFEEECRILDHIAEEAKAKGWTETARVARTKTVVMLNLSFLLLKDTLKLDTCAFGKKFNFLQKMIWQRFARQEQ